MKIGDIYWTCRDFWQGEKGAGLRSPCRVRITGESEPDDFIPVVEIGPEGKPMFDRSWFQIKKKYLYPTEDLCWKGLEIECRAQVAYWQQRTVQAVTRNFL